MDRVKGKVALVVGGAKGIGFAVAERLTAEGATVFITGRKADEVEGAKQKLGDGAHGLVADAAEPDDLEQAVDSVKKASGRIDLLVLNAGAGPPAPLAGESAEHFDGIFGVNVRGPVFALKAALPAMGPGGAVVLIGSVAGVAGFGTYAASKAALRSYARTWTAELAPRGIRVNVVSPGPTDTEMMAAVPDDMRTAMIAQIPLARMARPDEVASAVLFLLSDEAGYIAGVELFVDGGAKQV